MAESYQLYLNSKYADTANNNTYKFQLKTLDIEEGYYIYLYALLPINIINVLTHYNWNINF